MTQSTPEYLREQYLARINRAIDAIESRLGENLSLAEIAKVAAFSPYHFHRIFGAMVGETLNQFITRLRLERAATLLLQNENLSVTEIALDLSFSGSNAFARAFKKHFGMSASQYRAGGYESKIGNTKRNMRDELRKMREALEIVADYSSRRTPTWRITMKKDGTLRTEVEVKDLPERTVVYVRHVGPYAGDSELFAGLFERLCRWAGPRGLLASKDAIMMSVYHDNPEVTDQSKLRTSICVTVPEETMVEGEIGKMTVPGGKYAVGHFEIRDDEYPAAWNTLYGAWLPESGYQPDDRPCFEIYLNDPKEHPEKKCVVDICVPVKPM